MRKRTSALLAFALLSLLLLAWAIYLVSLPGPLVHRMPVIVHVIRRLVLTPPPEKLVWTDEDRVVQKHLEQMLTEREPPMRMVFDRVKVMDVRVLEERPDAVVFSEQLGDNGEVSMAISRDRIVRLEKRYVQIPEITLRDVRFYWEFPDKQFYKRPPYTIITDEPFLAVNRIVEEQQKLYGQFFEWMRPLITEENCRDDMQLLIFSNFGEYELYRIRTSDVQSGANGFYNIHRGRLVVSHQRDADWVKAGREKIDGIAEKEQEKEQTDRGRHLLARWKKRARDRLNAQASVATENILRHEGAHQLTYTLGVQNRLQDGRGWVSEGLATFFETGTPGGVNPGREGELRAALEGGSLIPLRELLEAECCETTLQYAQAWSLTCMLMQPRYQSGFFTYLDRIRKYPELPADLVKELCGFLPLTPGELEIFWKMFIFEN